MLSVLALVSVAAAIVSVGAVPSGHYPHIPIASYHPQLKDLGQHVDLPEIPTKIIRITKTVAIKVPVPYPVKITQRVPYSVEVNKPYPVVVPQIIKVPQPYPVPVHSDGHGQEQGYSGGGNAYDGGSAGGYDGGEYAGQYEQHDGGELAGGHQYGEVGLASANRAQAVPLQYSVQQHQPEPAYHVDMMLSGAGQYQQQAIYGH